MKIQELAFHKVLGYQYEVEDIGNGLRLMDREIAFNNALCKCDILIDDNDEIISVSAHRTLQSVVDVDIKLTKVTSNAAVKRYFENVLTRLKISNDQLDADTKAKSTIERIAGMGGILKVTNTEIYFELASLDVKIFLNISKGWDVHYMGEQTSSHDTLHQAVLRVIYNIREDGALLPNI